MIFILQTDIPTHHTVHQTASNKNVTVHHPEDDKIAPVLMHNLTELDREKWLEMNGRDRKRDIKTKRGRLEVENKQHNTRQMKKDKTKQIKWKKAPLRDS